MASLQLTVLGSGTSMGVPTLGCHCAVCDSTDPHDKRTRPSILLAYNGRNVVIDTTPDFRFQAMREKIDRLDAVLYTHSHADHILGLDDIRPLQSETAQRRTGVRNRGYAGHAAAAICVCIRQSGDGKFGSGSRDAYD